MANGQITTTGLPALIAFFLAQGKEEENQAALREPVERFLESPDQTPFARALRQVQPGQPEDFNVPIGTEGMMGRDITQEVGGLEVEQANNFLGLIQGGGDENRTAILNDLLAQPGMTPQKLLQSLGEQPGTLQGTGQQIVDPATGRVISERLPSQASAAPRAPTKNAALTAITLAEQGRDPSNVSDVDPGLLQAIIAAEGDPRQLAELRAGIASGQVIESQQFDPEGNVTSSFRVAPAGTPRQELGPSQKERTTTIGLAEGIRSTTSALEILRKDPSVAGYSGAIRQFSNEFLAGLSPAFFDENKVLYNQFIREAIQGQKRAISNDPRFAASETQAIEELFPATGFTVESAEEAEAKLAFMDTLFLRKLGIADLDELGLDPQNLQIIRPAHISLFLSRGLFTTEEAITALKLLDPKAVNAFIESRELAPEE